MGIADWELADYLIWGGLGLIIARLIVPRFLDWLGVGVEKRPKPDQE